MMDTIKQPLTKGIVGVGKQRTYTEVIDFLDKRWDVPQDSSALERIKLLDAALDFPSQKAPGILLAGTNGKSLTIHFTSHLLKTEGLKVGAFYAPHILTYNERLTINNEPISNKAFAEIANDIINAAEGLSLPSGAQELLTMMAFSYFAQQRVDVMVLEVTGEPTFNPVTICQTKIVTITRVTSQDTATDAQKLEELTRTMTGIVGKGMYLISGDQSKNHLHIMQDAAQKIGAHWVMPIRKLAALVYPFEQLHGRCAALAERTAQTFVEKVLARSTTVVMDSLLTKQKGQRGRPTIEEKRRAELYPKKTIEQFWKETVSDLPCRFQLLDKEKPTILLDNARNVDAFENLLLGIRLLHYQRPLKGLTIVVAAAHNTLHCEEFLKLLRYFFKKTSGQLFLCPLEEPLPGVHEERSWNVEQVTNDVKSMKVKARSCKNFEEAFELAKKSVDERNGLVVITGSESIIHQYWKHKGIKKF
jgi:dihydrofolate synthase / folylpolyglutamate synthase